MIEIRNLTVKNFMSVGNATQGIDFDRKDLTLVLGENLDLGGDGSRNGTGKTTIINALSYALYGQALSNIRKDNLVNKTNGKNMLVSLDFVVNGQEYKIERGRKPNVLRFYVNNQAQVATDEAQGDSRETQDAIEHVMNMSHDMFKHVLALNTYTEPFLSLKANDQRNIIEQLLGITLLSERADAKEQAAKTGIPVKRGRKASVKMNVKMPLNKGSKFTISMLTTYTGIDTVYIRKAVKEWLNDGVISINGSVKNETGRGKPSIEYVVV